MIPRASVDYSLAKRSLIQQVKRGEVALGEACDAHPELLRAAANIGARTHRACPICRLGDHRAEIPVDPDLVLREVTYLHGSSLRQRSGLVVWSDAELQECAERYRSFTAYVVECCLSCGWNHLVKATVMGRDHVPGKLMTETIRNGESI